MNFNWRTEVIRADPEWPYFSRNVVQFQMSNGRRFWDRIAPGEAYPWVEASIVGNGNWEQIATNWEGVTLNWEDIP